MDITLHIGGSVILATAIGAVVGLLLAVISLMLQEFASFGGISSIADRVTLDTALKRVVLLMLVLGLLTGGATFLVTSIF